MNVHTEILDGINKKLTEEQHNLIGEAIANECHLIQVKDRFMMESGTKTNIGVSKTLIRVIADALNNKS